MIVVLITYLCFLAQDWSNHVNSMDVINLSYNHISLYILFHSNYTQTLVYNLTKESTKIIICIFYIEFENWFTTLNPIPFQ